MRALAIVALSFALACGGARSAAEPFDAGDLPDAAEDASTPDLPDAAVPDAGPVLHTGVLNGISGLRYVSGNTAGTTDAQGRFTYEDGAPIAFYAGGLLLARAPGAAFLTPFALTGNCAVTDGLRKLLTLLASLDADPAAGIQLPPLDPSSLAGQTLADIDLAQALAVLKPGAPLADPAAALDDLIREVDGEAWQETSADTFSQADSAVRSQGVATDGASWFFSWRLGLSHTTLDYAVLQSRTSAIPTALLVQYGDDHIGDIDVHDRELIVPLEDSKNFEHPRVAFYDADSLSFRSSVGLDRALQPDGVPWVAVWDGWLVTSRWNPVVELHLWDMTGSFSRSIPLRPAQGRLQGLKTRAGMAYATRDSDPKTVIKINLETGTVIELFQLPGIGELEGLALTSTGLHTLNANPGGTAMEFRHHVRTRAPVREQVCP